MLCWNSLKLRENSMIKSSIYKDEKNKINRDNCNIIYIYTYIYIYINPCTHIGK